jgi:hypothetical protein
MAVELEAWVDEGRATPESRQIAYDRGKRTCDDGTAAYALARALLASRLAEVKGMRGLSLVREAESFARISMKRDPDWREGEAQRLLGSLLALAGAYVPQFEVEEGIELLEGLCAKYPQTPANTMRLSEALISAGDFESASSPLCATWLRRSGLRPSERRTLAAMLTQMPDFTVESCAEGQ